MSQIESVEISEDDDSFDGESQKNVSRGHRRCPTDIKGDENDVVQLSSDEDESAIVKNKMHRQKFIRKLFPTSKKVPTESTESASKTQPTNVSVSQKEAPIKCRMIGGVKVELPVDPYPCQIALMAKVIQSIKTSQNCLLESPTGSGKTLALLCGALAWQKHKKNEVTQQQVAEYFADHPDVTRLPGAAEYIATPTKKSIDSPEKFFAKPVHGHTSIYDPVQGSSGTAEVRKKLYEECCLEDNENHLVKIHKRLKLDSNGAQEESHPSTPEKNRETGNPHTPEHVHVPVIYYGARTHKQLQQVIREFRSTSYCGDAAMTVLSSRDNSCIREYDRHQWASKNDMCRGCIKKVVTDSSLPSNNTLTNCKYYDNKKALNHRCLPPAFDLEELVRVGREMAACPYYAAREMASKADVVFCPYNYLIDPGIRESLSINLKDNILIVDEAHNIEDICRDAATCTFSTDQISAAIKELKVVADQRYSAYTVDSLLKTLDNWEQWFTNQMPLVAKQPVNEDEAAYVWEVEHFVRSLHNHDIGRGQYTAFQRDVSLFTRQLRDDPRTMSGVSQATGALVEAICTVLGYLFRADCQYMDDFKPVLLRQLTTSKAASSWRSSQFDKSIEKEQVSLRLICLNPAVVFSQLQAARCIVLASGTLTPLVSLHSELGTTFPLKISSKHIIPEERVWIGTLRSGSRGGELRCASEGLSSSGVQDELGGAVLQVARVTPHGVLCFLPSYSAMNRLIKRWRETSVWQELQQVKHVLTEQRNVRDHNDTMEDYYNYVAEKRGAILFAVYRGKVSEGMDFKDHQARAVIAVGVPFPSTYDLAVKQKMLYNNKYSAARQLLPGNEWLRVQAYRALNQAVGRCVRHRGDWGAVLLVDSRFATNFFTEHLSVWVKTMLANNHHTYKSLVEGPNSLQQFMKNMTLREAEDV